MVHKVRSPAQAERAPFEAGGQTPEMSEQSREPGGARCCAAGSGAKNGWSNCGSQRRSWKPGGRLRSPLERRSRAREGLGRNRDGGLSRVSEGWVGPRRERGRNRSGREPVGPGPPSCHRRTQSDFLTWVTLPPRGVSITSTCH